jgi:hypothetical protein
MEQHSNADPQEAIGAACRVPQQAVPEAHAVREGKFLRQQQCDPAECVELRIHLRTASDGLSTPYNTRVVLVTIQQGSFLHH